MNQLHPFLILLLVGTIFYLRNAYLRARLGATGKTTFFDLAKSDNAIFSGMNSVVAAYKSARASDFGAASLANNNFACAHFLATKALHAKASAGVVVDVLA